MLVLDPRLSKALEGVLKVSLKVNPTEKRNSETFNSEF